MKDRICISGDSYDELQETLDELRKAAEKEQPVFHKCQPVRVWQSFIGSAVENGFNRLFSHMVGDSFLDTQGKRWTNCEPIPDYIPVLQLIPHDGSDDCPTDKFPVIIRDKWYECLFRTKGSVINWRAVKAYCPVQISEVT